MQQLSSAPAARVDLCKLWSKPPPVHGPDSYWTGWSEQKAA